MPLEYALFYLKSVLEITPLDSAYTITVAALSSEVLLKKMRFSIVKTVEPSNAKTPIVPKVLLATRYLFSSLLVLAIRIRPA